MIPYAREVGAVVVLAILAFSHGCAYRMGGAKDRATLAENRQAWAEQVAHAERAARETEQRHQKSLAAIAERYEQDKLDAQAAADRVTADLRAGNVRLRSMWKGCQATSRVSGAAASVALADAEDRLREASAGRIVGAVKACQSQRDRLIDVVEADRK